MCTIAYIEAVLRMVYPERKHSFQDIYEFLAFMRIGQRFKLIRFKRQQFYIPRKKRALIFYVAEVIVDVIALIGKIHLPLILSDYWVSGSLWRANKVRQFNPQCPSYTIQ